MRFFLFFFAWLLSVSIQAQNNMRFTSPQLADVVHGTYDPVTYAGGMAYDSPELLVALIQDQVNADSLKSYLLSLREFETRNTGSDTLSADRGIGAARSWILSKFEDVDARRNDRLETGYFQFDQEICAMKRHKNVVAVLPGEDPARPLLIIEAHMDSRCAVRCDVDCVAQGMEDNGSGTVLVIELLRVLSKFSFPNTILFMTTTGEEQGLLGANAVAQYLENNDISVKMVQNNDIVGGIICGETSSPPSCPGLNAIDSTQVRLFSRGSYNSPHKAICRFIKMQYQDLLEPIAPVPMMLTIMSAEDRGGRGGDHIPFRQRGIPAMRFTSAHEHGDASNGPDYHDRQHTSEDILGVDTDNDGEIDSFFVNFNYLARNTAINATSIAMAAVGPETPQIELSYFDGDTFYIQISSEIDYPRYVVGIRTDFNDFDSLYYLDGVTAGEFVTAERELAIFLSVAAVDSRGVESLFSEEVLTLLSGTEEPEGIRGKSVRLLNNRPNPFDEATTLSFWVDSPLNYRDAYILITDLNGRRLAKLDTEVREGLNEVLYRHGYGMAGALVQTLVIDDEPVDSKQMIFAN